MFKILVVEDDRDLNRTVCAYLNRSGYEATGCLNATDAYDAMYDAMFDLVVSDIMMPGIDGFEFASNVRALNENIPILFMTARDDIASKQRGFRIGVDVYMTKLRSKLADCADFEIKTVHGLGYKAVLNADASPAAGKGR